jgi:hypothetical protein
MTFSDTEIDVRSNKIDSAESEDRQNHWGEMRHEREPNVAPDGN